METMEISKKSLLDNFSIRLQESNTNFDLILKGIGGMIKFFEDERNFWSQINQNSRGRIILDYINNFINRIRDLNTLFQNSQTWNNDQIDKYWNSIKNRISLISTDSGFLILFSDTPHAHFILDLYSSNDPHAGIVHEFLIKYNYNINSYDYFMSYLKGYEFIMQNSSDIPKRRKYEFKNVENSVKNLLQASQDIQNKFNTQINDLDSWRNLFVHNNDEWQKIKSKEIQELITTGKEGLNNIHTVYKEQLKLEAPVIYWKNSASKYKKRGKKYLTSLFITTAIFITLLILFLYNPPEIFNSNILKWEPKGIKSIFLFATIVSMCIFITRTLIKLIYSAFHLEIDAEEREQLTMVYLALTKEGKIESEERKIVFESLFSRADTGLLGADSGPTMPGHFNILDKANK